MGTDGKDLEKTVTEKLLIVVLAVLLVGGLGAGVTSRVARRSVALASVLSPLTIVCSMAAGLLTGLRLMVIEGAGLTLLIIAASTPVALLVGWFVSLRTAQAAAQAREEVEFERRRREVEQGKRELITCLSHDLRTPLAGIKAMAEAIEDGVVPDPERYIHMISSEAERTAVMVDDVMSLARLQTGQVHMGAEQVNLNDLVSDMVGQLTPLAQHAGISVELDAHLPAKNLDTLSSQPAVNVYGDATLLNRVVQNVIANAIQYSKPGGQVRVGIGQSKTHGVLLISDECGGLSDLELTHMFDVGWRGDSARTPSCHAGSGLGLSIVRMIVDAHGGDVSVENHATGCCISVRIPLAD